MWRFVMLYGVGTKRPRDERPKEKRPKDKIPKDKRPIRQKT